MKYIVYGTNKCPNCQMAKALLEMNGQDYDYVVVGSDITTEELNTKLGFTAKSVPQIIKMSDGFGEYVGGFEDLKNRFG